MLHLRQVKVGQPLGSMRMACWGLALPFLLIFAQVEAGTLAPTQAALNASAEKLGSGNDRIHVIPSLLPYSIKNGEKLSVSVVVNSAFPVKSVTADLGGLATLELAPKDGGRVPGLLDRGHIAVYGADWTGSRLEEKLYPVSITVTDVLGFSHTDTSLYFSDPAAGNSTPGTTGYPPKRIGVQSLGVDSLLCGVVDTANGYAYFGTGNFPGKVVKVALGDGSTPPTPVGVLVLNSGENDLAAAAIDVDHGYAYFATATSPGRIVKVALGSGNNPPTRVGAVVLNAGEDNPLCEVIDAADGYAYVGTQLPVPGQIVKIALGDGNAPPTRVGSLALGEGAFLPYSAGIDAANGYAYFGTFSTPGHVVKVQLGAGDNLPTQVGTLTLEPGEDALSCALIDTTSGHAYFGTQTTDNTAHVVKVALGSGSDLPTRIGAATFNLGDSGVESAVLDADGGFAYFGTGSTPGTVVKVALGAGNNPPAKVSSLTLNPGEGPLFSAVADTHGNGYFTVYALAGRVVKVALDGGTQLGSLKGTRFTMTEAGTVNDVRFFSHLASGNVRLALYDDLEPKNLLWESEAVPNTAAGANLIVPVSEGTPSSLILAPGTYWAAWQVDTSASVSSFTSGSPGEGFAFPQSFGTAPAMIEESSITATDERWTEYITYNASAASDVELWLLY